MFSSALLRIKNDRPELGDAADALLNLIARRPALKVLDYKLLLREICGSVSATEIAELLHEIRVAGIATLVYRVNDRNGNRTSRRFNTLSERPEFDTDRSGNSFEVSLSDIEPTYEIAQ